MLEQSGHLLICKSEPLPKIFINVLVVKKVIGKLPEKTVLFEFGTPSKTDLLLGMGTDNCCMNESFTDTDCTKNHTSVVFVRCNFVNFNKL